MGNSKKELHLLHGGQRIGDSIHTCLLLNELDQGKYNKVVWHSGKYESQIVRFLCQWCYPWVEHRIHPIFNETRPGPKEIPLDLNDCLYFRKVFKKEHPELLNPEKYELDEQTMHFVVEERRGRYPKQTLSLDEDFPRELHAEIPYPPGEYILMQQYTISDWKRLEFMKTMDLPLPVIVTGWPTDHCGQILDTDRIFNGAFYPSHNWAFTVQLILNSKLFLGVNSSIGVMSYYLNHPTVILHYTDCPRNEVIAEGGRFFYTKPETCSLLASTPQESNVEFEGRVQKEVEERIRCLS